MRKIQLRQRPNIRGVGEQKTVAPIVEATPEVVEEETTETITVAPIVEATPEVVEEETTETIFETIKKAVNKITKKKASK